MKTPSTRLTFQRFSLLPLSNLFMEYAHTHPEIGPICISISLLFLPLIAVEVRVTVHSAFMDIAAIRLLSLGIRKGNSYFC